MEYQPDRSLEELAAFVAVVNAEGFRAAARAAQGRKATLSKRVSDLESRLGVSLLVRTTRSLRLTDEGRAYYEHASRALASARDAEAVVLSAKAKPRGVLRVTTSGTIVALVLDGVVAPYLSKYLDVRVELHTSERRMDVVREGFDVAIWSGALEDSSLVARRLGVANGGYYASPRYLSRRPAPARPEELSAHDAIVVPKGDAGAEWIFIVGGKRKRVSVRPRLVVTDLELAARAAAAGVGVVRAPLQIAQPYLAKKQLVAVLKEWTPPGLDVYAVFPTGGALVPKTRAFVDLLEGWFKRERVARGTRNRLPAGARLQAG
jgi:LysR family transcriptional regulator, regulator for bpeEF and oprC